MTAVRQPRLTVVEYLAYDLAHEGRHEFYNGEVVAMAGGSEAHALVTINLAAALRGALASSGCRVYSGDLRVRTEEHGAFVYPDLTVVCGPSVLLPTTPPTLTNPRLVAEVLSPSTAAHDRGAKAANYRRIVSLSAYVLVDIAERRVEAFHRGEDGVWRLAEAQGDAELDLTPLGIRLKLADIWAGLEDVVEDGG